MKFLLEYKSFYNVDDIVLIEYWYDNSIITPVKILSKKNGKFLVSHYLEISKLFNAPNELIKKDDIIDIYRN